MGLASEPWLFPMRSLLSLMCDKAKEVLLQKKNKALKVTPGPKNRHTLYVEAVGPDRCPGLQSSGAVEQPRVGLSEVGCHVGTQSYFEDIFFFLPWVN